MTALDRTRLTGPSRSMFGTDGAPRKYSLSGRAFLLLGRGRGTVFGSPQNIFTANRACGRIKWRHEHRFVATKKPQSKISAVFLVEVTGLEPTTSWSLRRRWLCSTSRALCFRRILAAAPPLPEKMLRLFSGSPSFRVSALVLRPRGGSCPALSQKGRRATCSAAFLVEVTGLAPLAARPGAQPTGLVQFAFPLSALKLRHANRSLYFGLRPRAPWLRNASASRHSLLMSDARASTLKSRQCAFPNQKGEQTKCLFALLVEVTGFEPTTSWSRTKRATKLRYTSTAQLL